MKRQESPTEVLRKRIAEVPTDPGIYRWLSKEGEVLYVGKAKSLRNRVRSYLNGNGKAQGPWKESLIKQIADFDVTVTTSELEALVLETNLIKKLRPKYNVLMKDDKNYVYVRITVYEDFPRIEVVRRIVEDGARYFGPYLSAYDTHRTLEVLHQIYGFKACKASLDFKNGITKVEPRECLEHQIGRCNGLCVNAVTQEQHEAAIDQVMSFFKGHRDPAIARLKEIMREVAAAKKFEKAGELRDSLKLFEHYQVGQLVSDPSGDNTDVVGVALLSGRASVVVMQQRGGKVAGEQQVNLSGQAETICDVLEQFLPQYYEAITDLPDTILVAEDFDERELLSAYLTLQKEKKVTVAVPARGKKSALLELAEKNALLKARQSEAKWEADLRTTESALAELQSLLHLQTSPKRIECYDISHMGGTETVGSMVVFKDAKPARDHYRSFTLRAIKTGDIDDYRAIREVLQRRFKYLMAAREKSPLTFKKFKKKEMEAWNTEHPKKMPIAKGWKQEIISIEKPSSVAGVRIPRRARRDNRIPPAENVDSVLGIDMRYKKGEMRIGAMELTTKDREQLHQALDLVEKKLGKDELYVFCNDPNARDLLALHGFFLASDGFEKLPSSFAQLRRASVAARPRRDGSEDKKTLRDQSDFARLRRTTPDKSIEGDLYHRQKSAQKADPSFKSTPDLIVIDGGKGQLSSAIGILNSLSVQIPVIGLAKREEEIFVPGTSDPVTFPNDAPGKFLLMRLRDEAHRFANEHRESRGKKRAMGSALDAVPGIGPKTKKLLLRKFGSVVGIREADDSALRDVVNEDQLAALRQHL